MSEWSPGTKHDYASTPVFQGIGKFFSLQIFPAINQYGFPPPSFVATHSEAKRIDKVKGTMNNPVLQALPNLRPPVQKLNVDDENTDGTALDMVVALRWLAN